MDEAVAQLIPSNTARKYRVVPLRRSGATLTVALTDPTDLRAIEDIRFITGCNLRSVVASEASILAALETYYPRSGPTDRPGLNALEIAAGELADIRRSQVNRPDAEGGEEDQEEMGVVAWERLAHDDSPSPVVRFVNVLLAFAIHKGASDIHVEPYESVCRIRLRIDGVLHETVTLSPPSRDPVVSRLKVMANLDIAERRLPQDGRVKLCFRDGGTTREVDFRVSCLPTLFGEKVVLRLLDRTRLVLDLSSLGLEADSLVRLEEALGRAWGMVLVSGPTGSGKTTTLYSAVSRLNVSGTNIMTAEDPVEFNMTGVNQVQIQDSIGLSFATVLRAFLRQDPNIILVGEIRDAETAAVSVKAALTGHLVLSTIHTNDAPSSITRLIHMGVEPFLLSSCLQVICAQRLVRRLCPSCAEASPVSRALLLQVGFHPERVGMVNAMRGRGCSLCSYTGFRGRIGLFEVMVVGDALRASMLQGAASHEHRRLAIREGMLSLRESGLRKIAAGQTTIEEVTRETAV